MKQLLILAALSLVGLKIIQTAATVVAHRLSAGRWTGVSPDEGVSLNVVIDVLLIGLVWFVASNDDVDDRWFSDSLLATLAALGVTVGVYGALLPLNRGRL